MTLEEFKLKVYSLIEEVSENNINLTEDTDLAMKFNNVTNSILNEICRMKKLDEYVTYDVIFDTEESEKMVKFEDLIEEGKIYQINVITGLKHDIIGKRVIFKEEGKAKIFYYKYPTQITSDTDDNYEFEIDDECIEIMMYGVAGNILLPDMSSRYGKIYSDKYETMLNRLDPRTSTTTIYFEGGVNI
jgi:hypothetical protein